ncbi:YT521-B-like domain-containing protein [Truncatella angustata]|uniref:YT521-B-like domain-containing protein n=1 Tax=Truncatella angustata TaxID=152316 RepID=A0A9P8ZS34_9PEZI|nr:YT521-B-like domain-containing protein [Truncatella angustata]KAH6648090.1 YT521-B-like domain-containing protein [Truncatella angustata]
MSILLTPPSAQNHDDAAVTYVMKVKNLDKDLEEWLEITRWHDVTYRAAKLSYHRTAQSVKEKRAILMQDEAKLQEFESKYGRSSPNTRDIAGIAPTSTIGGRTRLDNGSVLGENEKYGLSQYHEAIGLFDNSHADNPHLDSTYTNDNWDPDNRCAVEDTLSASHSVINNANGENSGHSGLTNHNSDLQSPTLESFTHPTHESDIYDGQSETLGRSRSRSPARPTRKTEWPRAKRTVGLATNLFHERREYRDPRSNGFKPINLGQKGDVRFFVIRSYSIENVQDAMEDGLWATKHDNAKKLCDIFESGVKIILIFGANKTGEFQGYARMTGIPSAYNPKPKWWIRITWPKSLPFTIEWVSKQATSDRLTRGLKNSLNEGMPITRSRDCQELDDYCGRALIDIMNQEAMNA